jgi:hypothetical protein
MRKLFILVISLSFAIAKGQFTYTWTNTDLDNDFDNANNWDCGFGPGFGTPTFIDNALFDGSCVDNCSVNSNVQVLSFIMLSSYSGTVDASGIDLTLTSINIQGGTFAAPAGSLHLSGNITKGASGIYTNASTSVLHYDLQSSAVRNMSGALNLNVLSITTSGSSGDRVINFGASTASCAALQLNGGSNPLAMRGTISVTNSLSIAGTATVGNTSTVTSSQNNGTILFSGSGAKTISGTSSALQNPLPNVRFNTTGSVSMSGNISVCAYSVGVPIGGTWTITSIGGLTAGTSTVTMIGGTVAAGTSTSTGAYFDSFAIASGSTTIFRTTSWVYVGGNFVNNGTFTPNTSLVRLNGGAQTISGASTTSFNAIDVANAGTKTISSPIVIMDSVGVSGAGTLAAGGNVTLRSVAGQKARIGRIASGGDVSGNVVVQNFFPGGTTGWANLASPGLASQTMADWNAWFGITCSGCPYTQAGGVDFESINSYDETLGAGQASAAAHYVPISSLADPIVETAGYWVYLGDAYPSSGDITAMMTGAINKNNSFGGYNLTLTGGLSTENGWNLISNPYPSPISLASMFSGQSGNVDNSILVWNTDLNGGNGDWSVHTLGGAGDIIPMGQGFAVRALTNGVALTGNENWKNISSASCEKTSSQGIFNINNLFKLNLTANVSGKNFDTYAYFDFSEGYVSGFDNGRDVYSLDNASGNTIAQIFSRVNSDNYLAAAMPALNHNQTMSFPLHIPTGYTGTYSITASNFASLPDYCFELVDLGNNVKHDLFTGPYSVNINANNGSTPRLQLNVTNCVTSPPVSVKENEIGGSVLINKNSLGLYVKTDFSQNTPVTITVTNILGQKIMDEKKVSMNTEMIYLDIAEKNQLLVVTVTEENGSYFTKKIVY